MAEKNKPNPLASKGVNANNTNRLSTANKTKRRKRKSTPDSGIPKEVANRMARRIAITSGIPTFSGMFVFIASYFVVSKGLYEVPPIITLATSAICFLIGLLGLSYGILSASWEDIPGTILGLENIKSNITRMKSAINAMSSNQS